jgi:pyruvate-formate lyase-activating enzyme
MSATLASTAAVAVRGLVAGTIPFSNVDGPGNRFVVFLQGCNFDCVACHNPQTIPGHEPVDGFGPQRRSVDDVVAEIRRAAPFVRGVTVSGGEATQQPAFLVELFTALRSDPGLARLTCFVDTNGACDLAVWDELAGVMDGAMVDLKCLDPDIHRVMTSQPNDQVLASIHHLHQLGRLYEVRLLIVVGVNDDPDLIRRTGEWLAAIDPHLRLKVIGFRAHGARSHDPPLREPSLDALTALADLLRSIAPFDVTLV